MDFGAIITWLQSVWSSAWVFQIISEYEEGVLLSFGRYKKSLGPGLHFKFPFWQVILTHYAKDDTILLSTQKLTTKDNQTVTIRASILYRINNIELFLTGVNDPQQALSDMTLGVIAEKVMEGDYADCYNKKIMNQISIEARRQAKQWGAYIDKVAFTDVCKSKTINLTKDTESHL